MNWPTSSLSMKSFRVKNSLMRPCITTEIEINSCSSTSLISADMRSDTIINDSINVPRRSMKGLLLRVYSKNHMSLVLETVRRHHWRWRWRWLSMESRTRFTVYRLKVVPFYLNEATGYFFHQVKQNTAKGTCLLVVDMLIFWLTERTFLKKEPIKVPYTM